MSYTLIITVTSTFNFKELVTHLQSLTSKDSSQFKNMYLYLRIMRKDNVCELSISDI